MQAQAQAQRDSDSPPMQQRKSGASKRKKSASPKKGASNKTDTFLEKLQKMSKTYDKPAEKPRSKSKSMSKSNSPTGAAAAAAAESSAVAEASANAAVEAAAAVLEIANPPEVAMVDGAVPVLKRTRRRPINILTDEFLEHIKGISQQAQDDYQVYRHRNRNKPMYDSLDDHGAWIQLAKERENPIEEMEVVYDINKRLQKSKKDEQRAEKAHAAKAKVKENAHQNRVRRTPKKFIETEAHNVGDESDDEHDEGDNGNGYEFDDFIDDTVEEDNPPYDPQRKRMRRKKGALAESIAPEMKEYNRTILTILYLIHQRAEGFAFSSNHLAKHIYRDIFRPLAIINHIISVKGDTWKYTRRLYTPENLRDLGDVLYSFGPESRFRKNIVKQNGKAVLLYDATTIRNIKRRLRSIADRYRGLDIYTDNMLRNQNSLWYENAGANNNGAAAPPQNNNT